MRIPVPGILSVVTAAAVLFMAGGCNSTPAGSTPLAEAPIIISSPSPTAIAILPTKTPVPPPTPTARPVVPTPTPAEVATPAPTTVPLPSPTATPGEAEVAVPTSTSVPLPPPTPISGGTEDAVPIPTSSPLPPPTATPGGTENAVPTPTGTPLPAPTPTLEEWGVQTPADAGYNTRVVDGDIHVWHAPRCPRISSAEWVAPIILTDLRSGSHLYLDQDGSVRTSPRPDYRSDASRKRFAEVLADSSLMELIVIIPFECPEPTSPDSGERFCTELRGWPDPDSVNIGDPPIPQIAFSRVDSLGGFCMRHGWTGSYCWQTGVKGRTCEARENWGELTGARAYAISIALHKGNVTVLGDESNPGRVTRVQLFPVLVEEPELELGKEAYSLHAREGETIALFELPDVSEGVYLLITSYESPLGHVEHGFKVELRN